jgi:ketosteroid isomerase-like protein
MSNRATVEANYQAFGRGDVPAILATLDDDVRWDHWPNGNSAQDAGLPWLAERTGPEAVGEFFASLGALEFHVFEPIGMLEGDGRVAALISVDVTVVATGRRFQDEEIHLWTFGPEGKVTEFRHHGDTGKQIAAAAATVAV